MTTSLEVFANQKVPLLNGWMTDLKRFCVIILVQKGRVDPLLSTEDHLLEFMLQLLEQTMETCFSDSRKRCWCGLGPAKKRNNEDAIPAMVVAGKMVRPPNGR